MIDAILPSGAAAGGAQSVAGADAVPMRGISPATGAEAAGADFGAMLTELASNAAGVVRNAESVSVAGIQGRASVQQVVEAVLNAEQTLQGAIAIRDKAVAAYLEVSRMQI